MAAIMAAGWKRLYGESRPALAGHQGPQPGFLLVTAVLSFGSLVRSTPAT